MATALKLCVDHNEPLQDHEYGISHIISLGWEVLLYFINSLMYLMQACPIIVMWFPATSAADVLESCEKYFDSALCFPETFLALWLCRLLRLSHSCSLKADNDEHAFSWHRNLNDICNLNTSTAQKKKKKMINGSTRDILQINISQVDVD